MADGRIDELRRRLERDPGSRLFAQLAEELRRAGELEEAIGVARGGLERNPAYPSARLTLGHALLDAGDPAGARAELEAAVRGAPDNILASRLLAEALEGLGNLTAALRQYEATLRMAPGDRNVEARMAALRAGEKGKVTGTIVSPEVTAPMSAMPAAPPARPAPIAPGPGDDEEAEGEPLPPTIRIRARGEPPLPAARKPQADTPVPPRAAPPPSMTPPRPAPPPPASGRGPSEAVGGWPRRPPDAPEPAGPGAPRPVVPSAPGPPVPRPPPTAFENVPAGASRAAAGPTPLSTLPIPSSTEPVPPAPPERAAAPVEVSPEPRAPAATAATETTLPAGRPGDRGEEAGGPAGVPLVEDDSDVAPTLPTAEGPRATAEEDLPPTLPPSELPRPPERRVEGPPRPAAEAYPSEAPHTSETGGRDRRESSSNAGPADAGAAPEPRQAPPGATGAPFSSATLAELYFQQGLLERAVEVYRQVLEEEPANARARSRLGEVEALVSAGASEASAPAGSGGPAVVRRRALERAISRLEELLSIVRRR